jgi:hypothetical protein
MKIFITSLVKKIMRKISRLLLNPVIKICKRFWLSLAFHANITTPVRNLDRNFLEKDIFQFLNSIAKKNHKLLFIGVAYYTRHYYSKLRYEVKTIDINSDVKKFGNKNNHTIGSATSLTEYYSNKFNVILANGLLGYGLNSKNDFNRMLEMCFTCLVDNGILIIGYNNNSKHLRFSLSSVHGYTLFDEFVPKIPSMNSCLIQVNPVNDHTFLFLKKRKVIP